MKLVKKYVELFNRVVVYSIQQLNVLTIPQINGASKEIC